MKKLFLWAPMPEDGTSLYRAWGPLSQLRKLSNRIELIKAQGSVNWVDYVQIDAAFLQRPFMPNHRALALECKIYNVPLISDWDDDLLNVPSDNPTARQYGEAQSKSNVEEIARMSDLITVSTSCLAELKSKFNKNVHVIKNALDPNLLVRLSSDIPMNPCVMWRGGHTHQRDLMAHTDSIMEAYKKFPSWSFVFMGYDPWWIRERMAPERCRYVPFNPQYVYYMRDLIKMRAAIHIVPLADNQFNKSKSDIAYLEASCAGSAVLAPNWEEWRNPGATLYENPDDFGFKLKELMGSTPKTIKEKNQEAWEHIQAKRFLHIQNKQRLELFEKVGL